MAYGGGKLGERNRKLEDSETEVGGFIYGGDGLGALVSGVSSGIFSYPNISRNFAD